MGQFFRIRILVIAVLISLAANPSFSQNLPEDSEKEKVGYKKVLIQFGIFLGLEHSVRLTQERTRQELNGPFFRDWFRSAGSINGWDDGGRIGTNWILHPMQGSTSAFIFAQNDPISQKAQFGWNKNYFNAKKRQFIFAVIYSENFELGPISESSIGNVGINGEGHGYIDHVLTPSIGILLSIGEDAADKYWIRPVMVNHKIVGRAMALVLNPGRSAANVLAGHWPWYRKAAS